MRLHHDPAAFAEALATTVRQLGLAPVLVEKDYWVSYVLRALAASPYRDQVVFKGGTALSKAYELIARFSEDVDLAIAGTEGWRTNRVKKLLDEAARHSRGSSSKRILLANWFWDKKAIFGGILTASADEPTPPTQHTCSVPNAPGSAGSFSARQSLYAAARHLGYP